MKKDKFHFNIPCHILWIYGPPESGTYTLAKTICKNIGVDTFHLDQSELPPELTMFQKHQEACKLILDHTNKFIRIVSITSPHLILRNYVREVIIRNGQHHLWFIELYKKDSPNFEYGDCNLQFDMDKNESFDTISNRIIKEINNRIRGECSVENNDDNWVLCIARMVLFSITIGPILVLKTKVSDWWYRIKRLFIQ